VIEPGRTNPWWLNTRGREMHPAGIRRDRTTGYKVSERAVEKAGELLELSEEEFRLAKTLCEGEDAMVFVRLRRNNLDRLRRMLRYAAFVQAVITDEPDPEARYWSALWAPNQEGA
jgi:hypothetical protein